MGNSLKLGLVGVGAVAMLAVGVAWAGPLTPPAGAVASSYKTLAEVEPRIAVNATNTPGAAGAVFRITQPGSYYLTGNVTGAAGSAGIEIASAYVSLDLNGFDVIGVAGSTTGISIVGQAINTVITNGSIRNWGGDGINFSGASSGQNRVSDVRVALCGGRGIVAGGAAVIERCHAIALSGTAIEAGSVALVSDCVITNCPLGIKTASTSTVQRCQVRNSGSTGGIDVGTASAVRHCEVVGMAGFGIATLGDCVVSDCVVTLCGDEGVRVQDRARVLNNSLSICGGNAGKWAVSVNGRGTRVEGNSVAGEGTIYTRGYQILQNGNHFVRNTASTMGQPWSFVAGNSVGPLVISASSGPVTGPGPSSLSSTDPHANFYF